LKRIVLWLLSTVSVVVLLFGYHTSTSSTLATSAPTSIVSGATGGSTGSSSSAGKAASGSSSSKTPTPATTVTGDVAQTEWGPVQVQLTVKGGTITGVDVLQHPNGNPRDDQINAYALPILVRETTDAQSANIDMVSGATVTSTGYLQSLQSALDQAGVRAR
jgi:uncharacterized protein with FMN-binding domain